MKTEFIQIKTYKIEFLTSEAVKLLGSTERVVTKEKNCENVLRLKITEVALIHYNTVNNED